MQLTKNFHSDEFACHCGCGGVQIDSALASGLQIVRDAVGLPVIVNSGYRCASHNAKIGGSKNSYHLVGMAADISVSGMSCETLYHYAEIFVGFRNGGMGIYPDENFIHVDVRGEHARWARVVGEYISIFEVV